MNTKDTLAFAWIEIAFQTAKTADDWHIASAYALGAITAVLTFKHIPADQKIDHILAVLDARANGTANR